MMLFCLFVCALCCAISVFFSVMAFNRSVNAEIKVGALEKSTHQVQMVPMDFEYNKYGDKDVADKYDDDGNVIKPTSNEGIDLLKNIKNSIYDRYDDLDN